MKYMQINKKMKSTLKQLLTLLFAALLSPLAVLHAETTSRVSVRACNTVVNEAVTPEQRKARCNAFGVDFIQLNGTMGQRVSYTGASLDMLKWEKTFLAPFKNRVGTPAKGGKPAVYIGLGKNMVGLVYWAAYAGTPEAIALKSRIFDAVIATQDEDGYIGCFKPEIRGRDVCHDTHEGTYLMKALAADHRIFGNAKSGKAAERLAAWWMDHWKDIGTPTWGMESCFLEFGQEGRRDFRFADWILKTHFPNQKYGNIRWGNPLGYNRWWDDFDLSGKDTYYCAASAAAQLWLNQQKPDPLLERPAAAMEAWFKDGGATLAGTVSYTEQNTKTQFGRSGVYNPGYERFAPDHKFGHVCSQAYVPELFEAMEQTGQPEAWRYDAIERIIYNSFFAAQSVEARPEWEGCKIRYDTSVEGPRAWYWQQRYCCPNNFRRYLFEIPRLFYRTSAQGLYVNLYESSRASIPFADRQWAFSQETTYPRDGRVVIHPRPDKPVEATLHFRIPVWVSQPSLTVNGEKVSVAAGSYAKVTRLWKPEDVVEINLPMKWQWIAGCREQQGRFGLLRGPLVFTLNPDLNKIDGYTDLIWEPKDFGEATGGGDTRKEASKKLKAYEPSYQLLRELVLDPASIEGPIADTSVYRDGIAIMVKGWKNRNSVKGAPKIQLRLTEFPDEYGRAINFQLNNQSVAVPDPVFAVDLKENKLFPKLWTEAQSGLDLAKLKSSWPKIPARATLIPALRSCYDELTTQGELAGRQAWMSVKEAARPYRKMGFRYPTDYIDRKSSIRAKVTVVYLDRGNCEVELIYDSSDAEWKVLKLRPELVSEMRRNRPPEGAFKPAGKFSVGSSGVWRTASFTVEDARFASKSDGKDILLFTNSDVNLIVGGVYVEEL